MESVNESLKFDELVKILDLDTKLSEVVSTILKSLSSRVGPDMNKKVSRMTEEVGKAIQAVSEMTHSMEDLKQIGKSYY